MLPSCPCWRAPEQRTLQPPLCRELRAFGIDTFECVEEEIEPSVGKGSVAVGTLLLLLACLVAAL